MLEVNIRSIFAHTEVLRGNASTICSLHNQLDQWREEVEGQPEPDLSQMQVAPRYHLLLQPPYDHRNQYKSQESPQVQKCSCRIQVPPAVSPASKTSPKLPAPNLRRSQRLCTHFLPSKGRHYNGALKLRLQTSNFLLCLRSREEKEDIGVKEYHHASRSRSS